MEISILKITLEMYSFFYLNLFFLRDIMLFRNGDIEDCLLFWHFSQCPGLFILTTVFSGGIQCDTLWISYSVYMHLKEII